MSRGFSLRGRLLRRLALLESPTPMSAEMSGVVHRLEGRLRRQLHLGVKR